MAKVIKLKQSDIEQIVTNIINEQQFDDFDTQIQPEELGDEGQVELMLGQDEEGNYYVMKNDGGQPEIIAKTK